MKPKILIIGKVPPPIGGVTIHVQRVLTQLQLSNVRHEFMSLNMRAILFLIFKMASFKIVHVHSSNPLIRLYLVLLSRFWRVKCIVTIHGNIGRFSRVYKNLADKWTIKLATKPIVLNEGSLIKAKEWNRNIEMISAFIPPVLENEYLGEDDVKKVENLVKNYEFTFCTNAYNKSFDKNGDEIYGIYELIESFRRYPNLALVISDPSGAYAAEIQANNINLPTTIILITGLHSFYKVMKLAGASIRNTTTDGDSLSVKESLYLNKCTYTTDVVQRPKNCILYKRGHFSEILKHHDLNNVMDTVSEDLNGYPRLMEIYNSYLIN